MHVKDVAQTCFTSHSTIINLEKLPHWVKIRSVIRETILIV